MHGPKLTKDREVIYTEIAELERAIDTTFLTAGVRNFNIIMGRIPDNMDISVVYRFLKNCCPKCPPNV